MKNLIQNIVFFLMTATAVNLLVSCVPKGKSPVGVTGSNAPAPSMEGTSDSGGGTGVEGKVFESYIVDPLTLPAYTEHLEKLLGEIKSTDPTKPTRFGQIFKVKTWYIAPIELKKITKDVLGVSFMKSDTQQIALQTSNSVWVDKRIYDRMSSREQADLLLHEMVMNIYFFKFISMKEICKISVLVSEEEGSKGCADSSEIFDKSLPAEPTRPLNDTDNENIRYVTGWLLQNAGKITDQNFAKILFNKGFDKRLFNPDNYKQNSEKHEILKISRKELFRAIKGAELTGNMPSLCTGLNSGRSQACKIEFSESAVRYTNIEIPGFKLQLHISASESIEFSMPESEEVELMKNSDPDLGSFYSFAVIDWKDKFRIGDRIYFGFVIFKKESQGSQTALILESVILKPGIIISADKARTPVCLVRAPNPVKFADEGLIIHKANGKLNMVEKIFAATEPMAPCNSQNVDDRI
jgi:hypothetical protein